MTFSCLSQQLYNRYIVACIDCITEGFTDNLHKNKMLKTVISRTSLNMLTQFCIVFDSILSTLSSSSSTVNEEFPDEIIECVFIDVS